MSPRKLFCQLGPFAYRLSVARCCTMRWMADLFSCRKFAQVRQVQPLPVLISKHASLIRRRLGNVDMTLQENKAINLALAAPKINGVLIRPGETFSFWRLVGSVREKKGYREGLIVSVTGAGSGIGGGMCQFTNLIHWMVLHTPLQIVEQHHHDSVDLFPDYHRQIPFGTGTSIFYNYVDYRFFNPTDRTYQLLVWTTPKYLCGELRADRPLPVSYHIHARNERFVREDGVVYRTGEIWRETVDKSTGNRIAEEKIRVNHARVMYDTKDLTVEEIKTTP